jgi:hypothetical protein
MAANTNQYVDAKDAYLKFNSQDISSHVISCDFPASWKSNDITTFGSLGHRVGPGIFDTKFTAELLLNQVATTGSQTVVGAAWYAKTAYAFEFGPFGSGSGNLKISGNAFVVKYTIKAKMGDTIMVTAEFEVDNGVTVGTYS